jgi:hypothetical protein
MQDEQGRQEGHGSEEYGVRQLDAALDFFLRARQSKEAIQSGVKPPHSNRAVALIPQ